MKNTIPYILFFWTIITIGQGQLTGVNTRVNMLGSDIQISQEFTVTLPDSIRTVTLKALLFEGTTFSSVLVESNGKLTTVKEEGHKGLRQFTVSAEGDAPLKTIMVSYILETQNNDFKIPLFFTNLPAAHSDIDFFKGALYVSENTKYQMHFPKVVLNELPDNAIKEVMFRLPALPAMIHLEVGAVDTAGFWRNNQVDIMVAFVFLGIGFLIWKNRKRLAYG